MALFACLCACNSAHDRSDRESTSTIVKQKKKVFEPTTNAGNGNVSTWQGRNWTVENMQCTWKPCPLSTQISNSRTLGRFTELPVRLFNYTSETQQHQVDRIDCQTCFPDVNPTEHLWDVLASDLEPAIPQQLTLISCTSFFSNHGRQFLEGPWKHLFSTWDNGASPAFRRMVDTLSFFSHITFLNSRNMDYLSRRSNSSW